MRFLSLLFRVFSFFSLNFFRLLQHFQNWGLFTRFFLNKLVSENWKRQAQTGLLAEGDKYAEEERKN